MLLLLALPCLAATWKVEALCTPDDHGACADTPGPTVEARALLPGQDDELPLSVGQRYETGTTLFTDRARVTLTRQDRPGTVTVDHHGGVRILDDGLEQLQGAADYDVEGDFRVPTRWFTAAVRGTSFYVFVAEDGTGTVAVRRGRVEVENALGRQMVRRGRLARVEPGLPPELRPWTAGRRGSRGETARKLASAMPGSTSIGGLVGARVATDARANNRTTAGRQGTLNLNLTHELGGLVAASLSTGLALSGEQRLLPINLDIGLTPGPLTVAVKGGVLMTVAQEPSAPTYGADLPNAADWSVALIPNVSGLLDLQVPLGSSVQPRVHLEVGWAEGLTATVAIGGSYTFHQ